jgi:hypothetical protein
VVQRRKNRLMIWTQKVAGTVPREARGRVYSVPHGALCRLHDGTTERACYTLAIEKTHGKTQLVVRCAHVSVLELSFIKGTFAGLHFHDMGWSSR